VLLFANDLPVAPIDVRDTGAVGARILLYPGPHAGETYDLTGKLTTYVSVNNTVARTRSGSGPLRTPCVHYRPDIIHAFFKRRQRSHAVRKTGSSLVQPDKPAERRQTLEQPAAPRIL
jgi:hypothetical protein